MTTIASFATFVKSFKDDKEKLDLTSVTVLSDSQWSWVKKDNVETTQQNIKKVFLTKEIPVIFAYFGDGKAGFNLLAHCSSILAANASARNAETPNSLELIIKTCFNDYINHVPKSDRLDDINIYSVFLHNNKFYHCLFISKKDETDFKIVSLNDIASEKYFSFGSGVEQFKDIRYNNVIKYTNINESAVCFYSFIDFLKSEADKYSSLPCQGAVINVDGNSKPIIIKHEDDFYLSGNVIKDLADYKFEFDFRDEEFEYLHANGQVYGGRKKYHFKDPTK